MQTEPQQTDSIVSLTPTWGSVAHVIALAMEHGTPEGKRLAREELFRMARAADVALAKSEAR